MPARLMRTANPQIKRAALALSSALSIAAAALLLSPREMAAHEPITTKIMFNKEVIRIFQQNCLGCHKPDGIAPMSLATYDEARPWAKAIKEELLEKRMPPWSPVRGYGDFRNAYPLTQREIDLIVNWVEGGAPRGKVEDLPDGKLYSDDWVLGKPDLVVKAESSKQVAGDAEERREQIVPLKLKSDSWLRAIDVRPDEPSVVHCVTFYVGGADSRSKATRSSETTKRQVLGTWTPGSPALQMPAGYARLLRPGSPLFASVHYRGAGKETKDKLAVGLYWTSPARPVTAIALESKIPPAGSANPIRVTASTITSEDLTAIAVMPFTLPGLASMQVTAYRPDGSSEVLVWTGSSKFDWQPTLILRNPVSLPKGTTIEVVTHIDNNPEDASNGARGTAVSN